MATTNTITRIQLIGDLKGYLDLDETTVLPLTYAISEVRDISTKKGTISKSIVLPASKNNKRLLNYYFDVNILAGTFNINKLQYCNVIQNGITILENALIQLVSINKEQNNNMYDDKVSFTVLVKDVTSDFFTKISDKFLTNITGLTKNLLYTAENVIDSFDNTYVDGYKFIMPFNPELASDAKFDLTEFSPGIYARYYFDKIFSNAGYLYNWPDMDSPEINFSKLIIPYNGDVIRTNKTDFDNYKVIAESTGSTITPTRFQTLFGGNPFVRTINSSLYTKIKITDELFDLSNSYNASASTYTTPNIPSATNNTKYKIDVTYDVVLVNNESTSVRVFEYPEETGIFESDFRIRPQLFLSVGGNLQAPMNLNNTIVIPNRTPYSIGTTTVLSARTATFNQTIFGINPNVNVTVQGFLEVPLAIDKHIFVDALTESGSYNDVFYQLRITDIRIEIVPEIDADYGYNVLLDVNRYVPNEIKQSDFIKSILTMFNAYVTVNKDNTNQLDIITRDKYYDEGKLEDWTHKLVKDDKQEIKFLPELQNKKYLLTYKADDDVANDNYLKATGEIYGQLEFTFNNDYVKDRKTPEIIFSPTPIFNSSFGAVLPMWAGGAPKNNIRILYDGGELPTQSPYTIYNYWYSSTNMNVVSGTTYPHISHWNKPKDPTFDLNFGVCSYYFRSDDYGSKTNNNLFNLHWRRTLQQLNSGKMLTAYFNLNETDIQRMKLNDKIRIDNSYWNINKIQDYNANSTSPTKVELISIDEGLAVPFATRDVIQLRRNDPAFYAINANTIERNKYINNNLSNGIVMLDGRHNLVTEDASGIVLGDNNTVNTSSFVLGNNNSVNVDNVIVIGDGITADTNNTLYANNIIVSGGTINNIPITGIQSQLELINISGNTGWRLLGQDPLNYGQIGQNAVDFSIQSSPSNNGATGNISFAEGNSTIASGNNSHAEGNSTEARGNASHSEGLASIASGLTAHAEGNTTIAGGNASHAEGYGTEAYGSQTHTQNYLSKAIGDSSHAGGEQTIANGRTSFIHSTTSQVDGDRSVVLGGENITGATDDTVYVPNLNINYQPSAATGTTSSELLLREADGTIKTITITDLISLLPSGMGDSELILDINYSAGTTAHTYTIIKDDLGYGTGLTFSMTFTSEPNSNGFYATADIIFPTGITEKLVYKYGTLPRPFTPFLYQIRAGGIDEGFYHLGVNYNESSTVKRFYSSGYPSGVITAGDLLNFVLVFRALP